MKSPCCAEPTRHRAWTGRSSGVRRAGPEIAADAAGASLGHAGHDPALASTPGRQEVDISPSHPPTTHRGRCGLVDRAHGQGESELGIPENPGRAAQSRPPRGSLHDWPPSQAVTDTAGTGPVHRHNMAAVLRAQASTMLACDFLHVDCAVMLKRIYVFVVLEVISRSVHLLGATTNPDGRWT